jgi:DNA-binding PadR family transcriptional regulator
MIRRLLRRRAARHQRAILAALYYSGPELTGLELMRLGNLRAGPLYSQLGPLEREGLILWRKANLGPGIPPRTYYRLSPKGAAYIAAIEILR